MGDRILKQKGQSTLETAVIFVAVILLLAGITQMWFWANNQIVQRQLHYNAGRVSAGTSSDTYTFADHWPAYTPDDLNEEDVLLDNER